MRVKRRLSKAIYEIYKRMEKEGAFEDCVALVDYANAILPELSVVVNLKNIENYEEQMIFFINHIQEGKVIEYALVKRVVGTEPYVTMKLEQDIRDVTAYVVVPLNEIFHSDNVFRRSIIISELEQLRDEFMEDDAFGSYYDYL